MLGMGLALTARHCGRGANAVINGTFDTDLSGWTVSTGGWAWSAGLAQLSGDGTAQSLLQFTLQDGGIYELVFDAVITSGPGIGVFTNSGATLVYTAVATGRHRVAYRAIGTRLEFKRTSGTVVGSIDAVDARRVVF